MNRTDTHVTDKEFMIYILHVPNALIRRKLRNNAKISGNWGMAKMVMIKIHQFVIIKYT